MELGNGIASTTSGEDWSARICGSVACVLAIAAKSKLVVYRRARHWFRYVRVHRLQHCLNLVRDE